jgi:hypothetical protein
MSRRPMGDTPVQSMVMARGSNVDAPAALLLSLNEGDV